MTDRQSPFANYSRKEFIKFYFLDWLLISLGLFLIILAFAQGQGWLEKESSISLTTIEAVTDEDGRTIFVDIAGAIENPGLYELPSDTRVNDLILACGGVTNWASRSFLEKNLNRARLLQDGEKIYIPYQGQEGQGVEASASDQSLDGKININQASHQELMTLPGIGTKYAQEIIDYRQSAGPFSSIEEIMQVKGIGEKTFADIENKIEI